MTDIVHADIFFFVSTISVAVFTVLFIILFLYAVRILSNLRYISERAKSEGDFFLKEFRILFERMAEKRFGLGTLLLFIRRLINRRKPHYG